MISRWESGGDPSEVGFTACAGDLVSPRVTLLSGAELKSSLARPVHLRYYPRSEAGAAPAGIWGGETDATDEVVFELDLAPFWAPYSGTIRLAGGGGNAVYAVRFERVRCAPARLDHTMTLRELTTAAVTLPRGTWALKAHVDTTVRFLFAGETSDIPLPAGREVPIGGLGLGTVRTVSGTLEGLSCLLRI